MSPSVASGCRGHAHRSSAQSPARRPPTPSTTSSTRPAAPTTIGRPPDLAGAAVRPRRDRAGGPGRRRRARPRRRDVRRADQSAPSADRRLAGADRAGGVARKLQPRARPRRARRRRQQAFGTAWSNPVGRLREHLRGAAVDLRHRRRRLPRQRVHRHRPEWPVTLAGGTPVPVYVAAMGPKALTGDRRTGRRHAALPGRSAHLEEFIVPTITHAADGGGRPAPRVIAAVPGAGDRRRRRRPCRRRRSNWRSTRPSRRTRR